MQVDKNLVNFPLLVHRDDRLIELQKMGIVEKHEKAVASLERLKNALTLWIGENVNVLEFVTAGDFENALLRNFGNRNGIPAYVKLEKYNELYVVPIYSHIVKNAEELASIASETLALYMPGATNYFTVPALSEAEEKEIVERNSVYLKTPQQYALHCAVQSLCDFINTFNFEISDYAQITPARVWEFVPMEMRRYLTHSQDERRIWSINYKQFKN